MQLRKDERRRRNHAHPIHRGVRAAGIGLAAALAACGGGGGGGTQTDSTSATGVPIEAVPVPATALPTVPSAYVRYVGEFSTLDAQGRRLPFYRSEFETQLARCNGLRGAPEYFPFQAPDILESIWYDADHDTKTVMYDSATGASRVEYRHAHPQLVMDPAPFPENVQCLRYRMIYEHYTAIVSSDGLTYRSELDRDTGVTQRMVASPSAPRLVQPLAWSDDWSHRTVAGQDCTVIPPVGDARYGSERCRWTPFSRWKFGVMPLELEAVDHIGLFDHRWTAVWASHEGLDRGPGFGLPAVDTLPGNVPVVMRADPPPLSESEGDRDDPARAQASRMGGLAR